MALTKPGELLRSTRKKRGLTLEDVERGTKIRTKFLKSIEAGDISAFHSIAYARGFIKNYAEFLGLDPKLVLALFRRETSAQHVRIIPQGMVEKGPSWFRMTPTRATLAVALVVVVAIFYYLFQEYKGFLGAPALVVDQPKEEEVVKEGEVEVAGKSDIDTTILVNGEPAELSEDGRFTRKVQVFKGETTLTVIAKNRRWKETTVTRKITVE